ncbi:hypothetical protein J6590_023733 [Homalodisca vitripennis]|nr:hypothetical protein J6590_023733 [Homalodisca vitripennis]
MGWRNEMEAVLARKDPLARAVPIKVWLQKETGTPTLSESAANFPACQQPTAASQLPRLAPAASTRHYRQKVWWWLDNFYLPIQVRLLNLISSSAVQRFHLNEERSTTDIESASWQKVGNLISGAGFGSYGRELGALEQFGSGSARSGAKLLLENCATFIWRCEIRLGLAWRRLLIPSSSSTQALSFIQF